MRGDSGLHRESDARHGLGVRSYRRSHLEARACGSAYAGRVTHTYTHDRGYSHANA